MATEVAAVLTRARQAAAAMQVASTDQKNAFLLAVARRLEAARADVAVANEADLSAARALGRGAAFLDRLVLDGCGLASLQRAVHEIAALPDPVGAVTAGTRRPNGLEVVRQRIPLGVIGIVYEARPNVTIDAAALCLKAGNCVVLRGGSESRRTNDVLVDLLRAALADAELPVDAVQQPATTERAAIDALVSVPGGLDLVIPRGGEALIAAVNRAAKVPVIQHYKGVCHLFVHAAADLDRAERVVLNAKCQRPGVCNAMEALLVDAAIATTAVPRLARALHAAGVEVRACPRSRPLAPDHTVPATTEDDGFEYLDLVCLLRVVDGVDGALAHIARHGSHHTEGILTQDLDAARQFVAGVDCSCAVVNASTRFNDGGQLGLGAEIGISTTKLHAYGPMGLESLTAERFVVYGQGQVRT
ncbi:MAG: glutamate-5-semialdehyde dehydrogenase [Myxococcales bacterium]|nr:glutamate-5-semialdehyde dehydrogenase [Myxococcales bacterium]